MITLSFYHIYCIGSNSLQNFQIFLRKKNYKIDLYIARKLSSHIFVGKICIPFYMKTLSYLNTSTKGINVGRMNKYYVTHLVKYHWIMISNEISFLFEMRLRASIFSLINKKDFLGIFTEKIWYIIEIFHQNFLKNFIFDQQ